MRDNLSLASSTLQIAKGEEEDLQKQDEVTAAVELRLGLSVEPIKQWRREYHALRRREARRKQDEKNSCKAATAASSSLQNAEDQHKPLRETHYSPVPISMRKPKTGPPALVGFAAPAIPVMPVQCGYSSHVPYLNTYSLPCIVPWWAAPLGPTLPAAAETDRRVVRHVAALGVPVAAEKTEAVDCKSSSNLSDFVDLNCKGSNIKRQSGSSSDGTSKTDSSVTIAAAAAADGRKPPLQEEGSAIVYHPLPYPKGQNNIIAAADGRKPPLQEDVDAIPYHPLPYPKCQNKNASTIKLLPPKEHETAASSSGKKTAEAVTSISNKRKKGGDEAEEKMPCVAARGPDGKTVTGFLYRYTKEEVNIVCVCHGRSFSPAEFLRHAGSSETSQALRRIIVVSSAGT
ncbi:hypothetical protein HPP92_009728 [Vanilla planifolia]|uniref:Ninja-family protein n=1 Tax=Vanilla planifolia TaxID=51239 RepID=A0A835RC28_VANPL|nr:hypothetical protein HPP92_009728 [Vanilla planifolia]